MTRMRQCVYTYFSRRRRKRVKFNIRILAIIRLSLSCYMGGRLKYCTHGIKSIGIFQILLPKQLARNYRGRFALVLSY